MPVLRVALDLPLHRLFDYVAAEASTADVGLRVRVPFGRGEKIGITENCLAAINPSDLRAISSLELLEKKSAGALPQIRLIDLKVVEKNYRLLTLKDEKGAPLFSDAARAFARAEILYAQKIQPELLSATRLCLIANFDTAPENETAPFSRAREILEARKKARLDTRVIQLPAGFTNR